MLLCLIKTKNSWLILDLQNLNIPLEINPNQDVVERLLEAGADLNARTEWGDTPVHYAAQYSRYEVIKQLVDKGAEINKPLECKDSYDSN